MGSAAKLSNLDARQLISKSSLSLKNTYIVTLTFDDDSLPNHLKTQQLTVYDELLEGCELITF